MSFRYLTAGESHGKALVGILEGIPSGLEITSDFIQSQLKRRKLGFGRSARQKLETDQVEILSGIRFGKTLGSPICLMIRNQEWPVWQGILSADPSSGDGSELGTRKREVAVPRPGHADLVGGIKYGHSDMRNVLERASARETAIRVGLGAVARRFLEELGIRLASRVVSIGSVREVGGESGSEGSLGESQLSEAMIAEIERAKQEGDTLGGEIEVRATGVPIGLGSYAQWDRRLEASIAKAFMSLNAIKGVEIGLGFEGAKRWGSRLHDEIFPGKTKGTVRFETNHSGGIEGGISTGQPICVRAAMKPLATLMRPLQSVNLQTGEAELAHVERSDVCAVPSAAVIGESLLAFVLTEAILEKFGGDSLNEVRARVQSWNQTPLIE